MPLPLPDDHGLEPLLVNKTTVIGGGAFGTSLAFSMARKGSNVAVWLLSPLEAADCNQRRQNIHYLPGVRLHPRIQFSSKLEEVLSGTELILLAIPTQFIAGFMKRNAESFPTGIPIVICSKGIELGTMRTPYDILKQTLSAEHHRNIAVLSGPSFAKELARGQFTSVAIASEHMDTARKVQQMVSHNDGMFRAYATTDVIGCEISSAVKNVLAIASGICKGLGMGLNARAALICRGLMEVSDLAKALGSDGTCLTGLAGVGDLLLTCSSELSRNFTVGLRLGHGDTMDEIRSSMKAVAEGVPTAKALHDLAKEKGVRMPICYQVFQVVHRGRPCLEAFQRLIHLPLGDEMAPALRLEGPPQDQRSSKL